MCKKQVTRGLHQLASAATSLKQLFEIAKESPSNSVGTATGYELDGPESIPGRERNSSMIYKV